ncbi:MAG: hypothetical protein WKF75_14720 [Singulisphaera sp.]
MLAPERRPERRHPTLCDRAPRVVAAPAGRSMMAVDLPRVRRSSTRRSAWPCASPGGTTLQNLIDRIGPGVSMRRSCR